MISSRKKWRRKDIGIQNHLITTLEQKWRSGSATSVTKHLLPNEDLMGIFSITLGNIHTFVAYVEKVFLKCLITKHTWNVMVFKSVQDKQSIMLVKIYDNIMCQSSWSFVWRFCVKLNLKVNMVLEVAPALLKDCKLNLIQRLILKNHHHFVSYCKLEFTGCCVNF